MNTLSNKTYSYCQVKIPKLYKCVTARSYGLDDDTSSEHTLGYATLRPVYVLKIRHHAVQPVYNHTLRIIWYKLTNRYRRSVFMGRPSIHFQNFVFRDKSKKYLYLRYALHINEYASNGVLFTSIYTCIRLSFSSQVADLVLKFIVLCCYHQES